MLKRAFRSPAKVVDDCAHNEGYSPGAKPDAAVLLGHMRTHHLILEVKCASPLNGEGKPGSPHAARAAFAATAVGLCPEIRAHYEGAARAHHKVIPLIHETFGGIAPDGMALLLQARERMRGRDLYDTEAVDAPWSAPSLPSYALQTISIALQTACANEVLHRIGSELSASERAAGGAA